MNFRLTPDRVRIRPVPVVVLDFLSLRDQYFRSLTGNLSSLGLFTPVVLANLSSREAARTTGVLLNVHRSSTASSAKSVSLSFC